MLNRLDLGAIGFGVARSVDVAYQLLVAGWVFAVGKTGKHLEVYGAGQPHLGCQLAMPFAWGGVVLLPIAFFGKVLLLVVGLHLG